MSASALTAPQLQRTARVLAALSLAALMSTAGWKLLQPRPVASLVEPVLPELRNNLHLPYFSFARALRPRS